MRDTSLTEVITVNAQTAGAKIVTATAGTVWGLSDWDWNKAVAVATFLFVLLQMGLLVPKYLQLLRAWRRGHNVKVDLK